ncbi:MULTISPECIES: transcriptional regulator [Streptomyces]|uniref:Transcriptional regulator n=1 Tax=Streptomyces venezuelae TaxID=54571 RepID=A0A5P2B8P6_STRVZ|nr:MULTISPECIES: transcriptional regulator [Streptomyces]NEA02525.1 transcriptional regulator [Streptomyces sp. SID10116]MYY81181.1 transcriptional regulator [Streptomyces sp. SID335]MYZ17111.1 transcriptional regulator [Streptomyces sp. SID337]NDZ85104.1 transcriptional regulator [Streptomyces sp. SID10115]NEB43300.1 transcriptional regulator [Streptomyces sp. SID339]
MQPNTLLDAILDEAGISHAGLAAHVNQAGRARGLALRYEHTAVSRWLKGQRPRGQVPDLICEVLAARLHRPVTLDDIGLGLPGVPAARTGTSASTLSGFVERATALWRSDEQQRPHLLGAPAVTGTPAVMPVWEWENPPEDVDVSRGGRHPVSTADIEMMRAARAHYEQMYRKTGGIATRSRIVGFLNAEVAPLLRGSYTDEMGRQLHRSTGGLVAIAGICAYDSDAHGLAQRYFHQALRLSKASGDTGLGAYVIALLVNQSLFMREYRQAVAFAEAALRAAGRDLTPALASDLYAMQAKAYAHLGDGRSALSCIRRAEAAADRILRGREPDETGYVQPGLVNVQVAEALLSLGDLASAREHAAAAVDTPAHDRGRVHRLAMLSQIELRQGNTDEAVVTAVEMAEQARGMESQRLRDRLRAVREHLVRSDCAGTAEAAELIAGALRVPL